MNKEDNKILTVSYYILNFIKILRNNQIFETLSYTLEKENKNYLKNNYSFNLYKLFALIFFILINLLIKFSF